MIALLLDTLGAYYLNRKVRRKRFLIPAAMLMGLASIAIAIFIAFLIMPSNTDGGNALIFHVAVGPLKLFWIHPIACAFFAISFRRKENTAKTNERMGK